MGFWTSWRRGKHTPAPGPAFTESMTWPPTEFTSVRHEAQTVQIVLRPEVDERTAGEWAESLMLVPWHELNDAYGDASEVPALFYAVAVGTWETREPAWWELWGNVHHQGTVYQATVPAVPFLERLARWPGHPDRVETLSFLRQVAIGDGPFASDVREAVHPVAETLVSNWHAEGELIRRALIWLSSVYPDIAGQHPELVALIPEAHRQAWDEVVARSGYPPFGDDESENEEMDREDQFEQWAMAEGWPKP